MIKISLDEGYVFDILSISEVKISKNNNSNISKLLSNRDLLKSEIINQIGQELFDLIYHSQEYAQLKKANSDTFDLVDKVKLDNGLAKEVDVSNYLRYQKKVALQKKFFNNEIQEIKIGYKNE